MVTLQEKKKSYFKCKSMEKSFWAVSFGPLFVKFTHNIKRNGHFQIMSKTEKRGFLPTAAIYLYIADS